MDSTNKAEVNTKGKATFEFTEENIRNLGGPSHRNFGATIRYSDTTLKGLAIEVDRSGSKSFCYFYKIEGQKKTKIHLGSVGIAKLEDVKVRVKQLQGCTNRNTDPKILQKKRCPTLSAFVTDHMTHLQNQERLLNGILLPKWGETKVSDINSEMINQVLSEYESHKGQNARSRLNALIRKIMTDAFKLGVLEINPTT